MGGGGSYYDRDVKDGYDRSAAGYSDQAKEKMGRTAADPGLLPKDRRLECSAKSPVVYAFDVTGSMGNLPRIIFDKMPLIAGQISECGYLQDPAFSLAAVGDIQSDRAPIQVCEFSPIRKLDDWLQRIWLEGNGGGQARESYEFTACFYARYCDLTAAETPFFIFTGDEGFRETLYANDQRMHFGGTPATVETTEILAELKRKFKGNVFLIKRKYSGSEEEQIRVQWEKALGREYVVPLTTDQAIADVTLGVFALMTGARTLYEYLDDLKTKRAVPQTDERITEVRASLERVAGLKPLARPAGAPAAAAPGTPPPPAGPAAPPPGPNDPPAGKKPGRIF